MVKKECCSRCGFPLDMKRDIVMLDNNIFSLMHYEANKCEECGHQTDGSTIMSISKLIRECCNKYINERKRLIRFIHHFEFLTDEEKKEVCLTLPRYALDNHKSEGKQEEDDFEEPFSWNVVYLEVVNNTRLSRTMLNNINWENIDDIQDEVTTGNSSQS